MAEENVRNALQFITTKYLEAIPNQGQFSAELDYFLSAKDASYDFKRSVVTRIGKDMLKHRGGPAVTDRVDRESDSFQGRASEMLRILSSHKEVQPITLADVLVSRISPGSEYLQGRSALEEYAESLMPFEKTLKSAYPATFSGYAPQVLTILSPEHIAKELWRVKENYSGQYNHPEELTRIENDLKMIYAQLNEIKKKGYLAMRPNLREKRERAEYFHGHILKDITLLINVTEHISHDLAPQVNLSHRYLDDLNHQYLDVSTEIYNYRYDLHVQKVRSIDAYLKKIHDEFPHPIKAVLQMLYSTIRSGTDKTIAQGQAS